MIPLKENWYPDAGDEANIVIWEEMRNRIAAIDVPSLMLHFLHETMHAWYPRGNLADHFFGLASRFETEEEAFDHVTEEVLMKAARMMEEWLATQDQETRDAPAMQMPSETQVPDAPTQELRTPESQEEEEAAQNEDQVVTPTEQRVRGAYIATMTDVLDAAELEDTFSAGAESVRCGAPAPHDDVDPIPIVARMLGPPLPPAMLAERELKGMAVRAHDKPPVCLVQRDDKVVGPLVVVDGHHHACLDVRHVGEHNAQETALVLCKQDQIYVDGRTRTLRRDNAEEFMSMVGATGGLRYLGARDPEPPDRVEFDVGSGRHSVALAAAAELATATGVRTGVWQQPTVGRSGAEPVDRGWLTTFRARRNELMRVAYSRYAAEDGQARRLRARYAWCRDIDDDHSRIKAYRERAGMQREPEPPWARAVSDISLPRIAEVMDAWPTGEQMARIHRACRVRTACTVVEEGRRRWRVILGRGEADFWGTIERAALQPWPVLIQCEN